MTEDGQSVRFFDLTDLQERRERGEDSEEDSDGSGGDSAPNLHFADSGGGDRKRRSGGWGKEGSR